jgi:hypothetical protein
MNSNQPIYEFDRIRRISATCAKFVNLANEARASTRNWKKDGTGRQQYGRCMATQGGIAAQEGVAIGRGGSGAAVGCQRRASVLAGERKGWRLGQPGRKRKENSTIFYLCKFFKLI